MAKDLRDLAGFGSGSADSNQLAEAFGLLAWTGDPRDGLQAATDSSGSIHGCAVWLPAGVIVSKIAEGVTVAGVGMTHAFMGLFDVNFNLLAQSADTPAAFQTTGWIELPLTTAFTTQYSGVYYVADCLVSGTTMPTTMNTGSNGTSNFRAQLPNGAWRYFTQTGVSAFPATITPAISGLSRIYVLR